MEYSIIITKYKTTKKDLCYKFNKSNLAALKNLEKDAIYFKCNDKLFQPTLSLALCLCLIHKHMYNANLRVGFCFKILLDHTICSSSALCVIKST